MKIDLEEIKLRLFNKFGDRYKFNFDNFKTTHSKIEVICPLHGSEFKVLKNLFKGHGCKICGYESSSKNQKFDESQVLNDFREKHGDRYDYSEFIYTSCEEKSIIICKEHGEFEQSYIVHKNHGCPSCSNNKKFDTKIFTERCDEVHDGRYDYTKVDYKNAHIKVCIVCKEHGEFNQLPMHHIRGVGCPRCNSSKGEVAIEKFLIKNDIKYVRQQSFDGCIYKANLLFDYYLPEFNTCVEFNGMQHYKSIPLFGGDEALELNIIKDKIKYDFCIDSSIRLIVIKQDKKHFTLKEFTDLIDKELSILINSQKNL